MEGIRPGEIGFLESQDAFLQLPLANHEVRKALKRLSALTRGRPHFSEIEVGVKGHRAATSL